MVPILSLISQAQTQTHTVTHSCDHPTHISATAGVRRGRGKEGRGMERERKKDGSEERRKKGGREKAKEKERSEGEGKEARGEERRLDRKVEKGERGTGKKNHLLDGYIEASHGEYD